VEDGVDFGKVWRLKMRVVKGIDREVVSGKEVTWGGHGRLGKKQGRDMSNVGIEAEDGFWDARSRVQMVRKREAVRMERACRRPVGKKVEYFLDKDGFEGWQKRPGGGGGKMEKEDVCDEVVRVLEKNRHKFGIGEGIGIEEMDTEDMLYYYQKILEYDSQGGK
jgi:hypothetical protein